MRRRAQISLVLGALLLGLGLSSWLARRSPPPSVERPGSGVILFAPNLSESAWALGYGKSILAVTDYCTWPPELLDLPRVGGMVDPNLERILALDPGLLVVQGESRILSEFAREHGISLQRVDMDRDLASILDGFDRLDSLLGRSARPGARALLTRLEAQLDAVRAAVPAGPRPRTLLSLGHDPAALTQLWSMGQGSFLLDLLELAGGQAPFDPMPDGYFELGLERLVADPPELVIELRPGESLDASAREAITALWRAQGVDAPVEFVQFEGVLIPGPRIAQTARALRSALDRARTENTH